MIVRDTLLHYQDHSANSDKVYRVLVEQTDALHYRVTGCWGRRGQSSLKMQVKGEAVSFHRADNIADELISQKRGHGYTMVSDEYNRNGGAVSVPVAPTAPVQEEQEEVILGARRLRL